jgi:hypothetical protein
VPASLPLVFAVAGKSPSARDSLMSANQCPFAGGLPLARTKGNAYRGPVLILLAGNVPGVYGEK